MSRSSEALAVLDLPAVPAARSWRGPLKVALGLLAVVNVLFFALLLKPAGERARERRSEFDRLLADLESGRANVAHLRSIAENLGQSLREGNDFYTQKFLPKPTGFSIIVEELDKLAQASRVRKGTVSYQLSDMPNRPDLNQVDITTVLEGDYGDIVRFINSVERSPLFLIIDSITVAGGSLTPGQPRTVRLSLRLVTFCRV